MNFLNVLYVSLYSLFSLISLVRALWYVKINQPCFNIRPIGLQLKHSIFFLATSSAPGILKRLSDAMDPKDDAKKAKDEGEIKDSGIELKADQSGSMSSLMSTESDSGSDMETKYSEHIGTSQGL